MSVPPSTRVPLQPSTHSRLNRTRSSIGFSTQTRYDRAYDTDDDADYDPGTSLSGATALTKDHRIPPRPHSQQQHRRSNPHQYHRRNSDVSIAASSTPRPASRHAENHPQRGSDSHSRRPLSKQQSLSSISSLQHRNARLSLDAQPARSRQTRRAEDWVAAASHSSAAADMEVDQPPLYLGDTVSVPGGMAGTVKFIGTVQGKTGTFAGVELDGEFASRGKNDGDVDGIRYFTTSVPGAGIFLPTHRAVKLASPTLTPEFPPTPTTPGLQNMDMSSRLNAALGTSSRTPPTPSIPKFSQSVGPGSRPSLGQSASHRAASPQLKQPGKRPSLPQQESPQRRQAPTSTPARTSTSGITAAARRLPLSPAPRKNAPSKPSTPAPPPGRSISRSHSRQAERSPEQQQDNKHTTPPGQTNGLRRDSFQRPATTGSSNSNEEATSLKRTLEERDRQLKEQASSLAEMEKSLGELQSMMVDNMNVQSSANAIPEPGTEDADSMQLRVLLREKNEKIAMLTAEFDGHRGDFRSTIDALEMASTETERVYEKRIMELLEEVKTLQEAQDDVASITQQLKALEELVAELEEGLEDSRRGESEARSEVEFLRGEVERSRSELRRERDKAAKALKGAGAAVGEATGANGSSAREVEARDDEIRGLKAIIHSLSSGPDVSTPRGDKRSSYETGGADAAAPSGPSSEEYAELQKTVDALQREKGELQGLIERKNYHEEQLERELTELRQSSSTSGSQLQQATAGHEKSPSDSSTGTARTAQENHNNTAHNSMTSTQTVIGPDLLIEKPLNVPFKEPATKKEARPSNGSSESAESSLWCDICEQAGHDVLTCTNIGNPDPSSRKSIDSARRLKAQTTPAPNHPVAPPPDSQRSPRGSLNPTANKHTSFLNLGSDDGFSAGIKKEASASTMLNGKHDPIEEDPIPDDRDKAKAEQASAMAGDGPAPGKTSMTIDMTLWCAMCERDGHSSVDCPFDDF